MYLNRPSIKVTPEESMAREAEREARATKTRAVAEAREHYIVCTLDECDRYFDQETLTEFQQFYHSQLPALDDWDDERTERHAVARTKLKYLPSVSSGYSTRNMTRPKDSYDVCTSGTLSDHLFSDDLLPFMSSYDRCREETERRSACVPKVDVRKYSHMLFRSASHASQARQSIDPELLPEYALAVTKVKFLPRAAGVELWYDSFSGTINPPKVPQTYDSDNPEFTIDRRMATRFFCRIPIETREVHERNQPSQEAGPSRAKSYGTRTVDKGSSVPGAFSSKMIGGATTPSTDAEQTASIETDDDTSTIEGIEDTVTLEEVHVSKQTAADSMPGTAKDSSPESQKPVGETWDDLPPPYEATISQSNPGASSAGRKATSRLAEYFAAIRSRSRSMLKGKSKATSQSSALPSSVNAEADSSLGERSSKGPSSRQSIDKALFGDTDWWGIKD